jgi:3-dehydroquinate synthase
MRTIQVELGERSYPIVVTHLDPQGILPFVRQRKTAFTGIMLIADTNTESIARRMETDLAKCGLRSKLVIIPAGESSKSLEQASHLYDELAEWSADRHTLVFAIGGGVIGDLAGFVAATFNRGIPFMIAPTTLLAMVDSSVGGKVGINHSKGKNLIGSFHQPDGVWIDTAFLDQLPDREYRSGLAEVVKYGVIMDPEFFTWMEENVSAILDRKPDAIENMVATSCRLKANVVEKDEREETGLRMILNYGHTFAHAYETVGGYGSWLHGEAVSAGMISASRLAEKLGRISSSLTNRQIALLDQFQLPTKSKKEWKIDDLIACMYRDKKTKGGKLRFVLPSKLGNVETVNDVPVETVRQALEESC